MKFFISAIIILLCVSLICGWMSAKSITLIDEMLDTLSSLKTEKENVPQNAEAVLDRFGEQWEKRVFLISMLLPHHHLDEVKEKWVSLRAYANTDEFAEWQEALLVLEEELSHVRGLIKVSADNVL